MNWFRGREPLSTSRVNRAGSVTRARIAEAEPTLKDLGTLRLPNQFASARCRDRFGVQSAPIRCVDHSITRDLHHEPFRTLRLPPGDDLLWAGDGPADARVEAPGHQAGGRTRRAVAELGDERGGRRGGAEAVEAGIAILRDGGNAADAAVATILAQSVTDANQFCFGGEVPIVVYDAKRKVVEVLAGQGVAPRLATREHFTRPGGIPASGIEAAAVPATLDVCLTALDRYGTKRFAEVVAPALRILDRGEHAWHADLARTLRRLVEAERVFRRSPPRPPAGRRLLLPRADRPRNRRLVARQRRPDPRGRPGHARHPRRGAGRDRVPRPRRRQVRSLDARARAARSPATPRRLRPGDDGPQPARRDPRDRRGHQARVRRSRRLLCRPALSATSP